LEDEVPWKTTGSNCLEYCRNAIRFGSNSAEADRDFWAYEQLDELCSIEPSRALAVIQKILHLQPEARVLHDLAAGPLEDLLARSGPAVSATVEALAKKDNAFLFLIGSVWPDRMPTDIRDRIQPLIKKADAVPSPRNSKDH
jgi:hypothetical protein